MGVRFSETQRVEFRWVSIGFLALVALSAWRHSLFGVLLYGGVLVMMLTRTLRTDVDDVNVRVRFPWGSRTIPLSSIQRVDTTTYYPGIDGSWGIREGRALRLWLSSGDFVLVGTQHPQELRRAITDA
jgi:hypothetical protein